MFWILTEMSKSKIILVFTSEVILLLIREYLSKNACFLSSLQDISFQWFPIFFNAFVIFKTCNVKIFIVSFFNHLHLLKNTDKYVRKIRSGPTWIKTAILLYRHPLMKEIYVWLFACLFYIIAGFKCFLRNFQYN